MDGFFQYSHISPLKFTTEDIDKIKFIKFKEKK